METEKKQPKPYREFRAGEIDAAHRLYMELGPKKVSIIANRMGKLGYRKFGQKDIVGNDYYEFPGLAELHGWVDEWAELHPEEYKKEEPETAEGPVIVDVEPRMEKASVSFKDWLIATERGVLKWDYKYQTQIYKALGDVTRGRQKRLMLFMPPRHGKSEMVTIRYAAWRLLHDPSLRIVIASYSQKLATRFSRRVRSIYTDTPYVEPDESELVVTAVDEWETRSGGGVKAVGVGAGITGFGADLIIIDDPVKGRAEAESKNQRDTAWEWFTDDLTTRLDADGAVILIQTRWHEDDLAGRLLSKGAKVKSEGAKVKSKKLKGKMTEIAGSKPCKGNDHGWKVISLPALAHEDEPGKRKALCPERFPVKELLKRRDQMGSYSFAALYQQAPMPAGGGLFKRDWFSRIVPAAPAGLRWFRGYDLAVSTRTSADYTASFRVAVDKRTGDLYIADGVRARMEFPEQRKFIVGRIRDESDTEHGIEEALHGQAFVQELWRDERLGRSVFRGVRVTTDKYTRALTWANRAEAGKVVLVRGPWIDQFLDEVTHFPNSAHDDQVDAVSLAVQMTETRSYKATGF